MVETNITRRRVMQGAGAVGIAGVVGSSVVTAQEDNETDVDDDQAALRVAHATPDAPGVDVRIDDENEIEGLGFREVSDYTELESGSHQLQIVVTNEGFLEGVLDDLFGGDDEDDDETVIYDEQVDLEAGTTYTVVAFGELRRGPVPAEGGADVGGNETDVGGNETDVGGNETDVGDDNETDLGTDDNETDLGTDDNETDVGGNETDTGTGAGDGEQVIEGLAFGEHDSFELEAGDYTLEISEAQAAGADGAMTDGGTDTADGNATDAGAGGNDTDVGADDNETDLGGDNETTVGDNETDAGVGDLGQDGAERGFQVELLEDDLTDPGEDRFRLRVFHAVPDVDTMSITATETEGDGGLFGGDGDNETGGDNETVGDDNETGGGLEDDNETGGGLEDGNETDVGDDAADDESVQERDISPSGASVYSGFAVGYFDPEAAAGDNETGGGLGDDNETGGGLGDDNETDVGDDGNATGGNETEDEEIVEDPEGEEFELVTVKDSEEGERADGGTGGGLF